MDGYFFSVLWTIWVERNAVIFNAGSYDVTKTFFLAIHRAQAWLKALGDDGPLSSRDLWLAVDAVKIYRPLRKPKRVISGWQSPPLGELKWNVDGSALGKSGLAAAGGVLRDHAGLVKCLFSVPCGIMDSNFAEVIAIRKALQLSSFKPELFNVKISIESDSANAVAWVNQKLDSFPWKLHNELCRIENLMALFQHISVIHSIRENNFMADALAKQGLHRDRDFVAWL